MVADARGDPGDRVDPIVELNGAWEGREKVAGVIDQYSGARVLWLSPSVPLCRVGLLARLSVGFFKTIGPGDANAKDIDPHSNRIIPRGRSQSQENASIVNGF